MIRVHTLTLLCDDEDTEVSVDYVIHPGLAAKTYVPPENCYPAEPAEVEIIFTSSEVTDAEEARFLVEIMGQHDWSECAA